MTDVQEALLSIYKQIKAICEKHNIVFYADGGTKLGAARHGGFIPWDDDMDLAMPLHEYDRFLQVARKELGSRYRLLNGADMDHVDYSFARIIDVETTFIHWEDFPFLESYGGIAVDIFPYIGINSNKMQSRYNKELDVITDRLTNAKIYESDDDAEILLSRQRALFKKFPFNEALYIRNGATSMYKYRAIFHNSWQKGERVWLPFEDTEVPASPAYKDELQVQYGDYMTLPPKEKRVSHHGGISDATTGYNNYTESLSGSHLAALRSYVHQLQVKCYRLDAERQRLLQDFERELKHKEYFIQEGVRKYNEEQRAREKLQQEYDRVLNTYWWRLRRMLRRIVGR